MPLTLLFQIFSYLSLGLKNIVNCYLSFSFCFLTFYFILEYNWLTVLLVSGRQQWFIHIHVSILFLKWALGSITMNKARGGDGIPAELFQILKDDAVKVLHSICQQTWKTQQWPQDSKRLVFIPILKKGNAKECSDYCIILHSSYILESNAENSPNKAWAVHELRTSRCSSWI